jgi:hypothetical protein
MNAWVRTVVATACFAATGLLAPAAYGHGFQPQNLVVNGDFSANGGSLEGWTYNTNVDNFYWQFTPFGTTDDASNGCTGIACITGPVAEQNYLYQTIHTIPGFRYKLTFTYDAGAGGVNELQVLAGQDVVKDLVNLGAGSNTYTVYFVARRFDTKLDFLGRQDNAFSFLTDISVTCE